jgi:hypothetical protein
VLANLAVPGVCVMSMSRMDKYRWNRDEGRKKENVNDLQ